MFDQLGDVRVLSLGLLWHVLVQVAWVQLAWLQSACLAETSAFSPQVTSSSEFARVGDLLAQRTASSMQQWINLSPQSSGKYCHCSTSPGNNVHNSVNSPASCLLGFTGKQICSRCSAQSTIKIALVLCALVEFNFSLHMYSQGSLLTVEGISIV